ncbi:MAG: tRNA pseudouridine(38-40) synthase TruA [Candidatus Lokiarchaeota archaeon]|nr:tRNA pseudouridine(38-40) synthase TruA [Candidatus Lokiarchaeota archaeon]
MSIIKNLMKKKVAFKVFYIGSNYYGLQKQPNLKTIEGEIKNSLINKSYINSDDYGNLDYSSRTDSGVHALEQIISFKTDKRIIIPEINHALPKDIIFWACAYVDNEFNPRYDVISRHYKYIFVKDYNQYDINLMKKVAILFIGEHDFTNFSKIEKQKNPYREILKLEVKEIGDCFVFDVVGKSFLRQMVRRIAKAILEVGSSQISVEIIQKLLEKSISLKDKIGPAPLEPYGSLILYKIENNLDFMINEYSQEKLRRIFYNKIREYTLKTKTFETFLNEII